MQEVRLPIIIPTTMRRQDSGKMLCSFGVMWNPKNKKKSIRIFICSLHLNIFRIFTFLCPNM